MAGATTSAAATAATTATTTRPGDTPMVTPRNAKKRARSSRTQPPVLQDGLEAGMADVLDEEGSQQAGSAQQEQQKQQKCKIYGMQWQQLSKEDLMAVLMAAELVALSFPNLSQGLGT
eukprot:5303237-Amphidinium_carterae.2